MQTKLNLRPGWVAGLWLLLGTGMAGAQTTPTMAHDPCRPWLTLGTITEGETRIPRSCMPYGQRDGNFRLQGLGDFAGSGMRSQNNNVTFYVTNAGPMDTGLEYRPFVPSGEGPMYVRGTLVSPTAWNTSSTGFVYNSVQFAAAASRTDWLRNRELVPSLRNAKGGGWTTIMNTDRLGGAHQWQGADGSVGRLHSGEQARGQGCFDHGSGTQFFQYGFPLLAGSDCPETWGSIGWQGKRWVGPIDNWVRYFNDTNPDDFTFEDRYVPPQYWQTTDRPMTVSDNFQVYGAASDWGAEARRRYGNVIPGQGGDPDWEGYPIGLTIEFDIYSFKVPATSGGFIHDARVINDSEKVYGVPLDYDSVWFGYWTQPSWNTKNLVHPIPELGTVVMSRPDMRAYGPMTCTSANMRAVPAPAGLAATSCAITAAASRAFGPGGAAITVLRSPLGDLRNKHFSNPESPFYAPGHPLAGDTITFNRLQPCQSENCMQNMMILWGTRATYGMITANPLLVLNGNDPRQLDPRQRFELFQGELFAPLPPGQDVFQFCDPAQPRMPGCTAYVVPGTDNYIGKLSRQPTPTWTYSRRPPGAPIGPDTLFFYGCRMPTHFDHPNRNQCPDLYTDTSADRTRLYQYAGMFGPLAGPFPMKANDTVPFVAAFYAAPLAEQWISVVDGVRMPGPVINDWYNFYVNDFYLGPSQPPPPSIISVTARGGSSQFGDTELTLFLDNAAESWRDPYTLKFIEDLRNPTPGTFPAQIRAADPTAADRLLAAIDHNIVDTVFIYKSCDLGRSLTTQQNIRCERAPVVNAQGVFSNSFAVTGARSQVYAVLTPNAQGRFAKSWTDGNVAGGRRYWYSLVAVTRGVSFDTKYRTSAGEIRDTTLQIITPGRTPFSFQASNPWVTEVYVPLMEQAGSQPARTELIREQGPLRWQRLSGTQISVNFFANSNQGGTFRLLFGQDAIVQEYRRIGARDRDSTVVTLKREVQAVKPDGTIVIGSLPDRRFVNRQPYGIAIGGDDAVITRSTQALANNREVRTTQFNRKAGLLFDATNDELLFASGLLTTAGFTPPDFTSHPAFRRFTIGVNDSNALVGESWRYQGVTMPTETWPSVVRRASTLSGLRSGTWAFLYKYPVFGPYDQLPSFDVNNRQRTADAYYSLLERRGVARTTVVNEQVLNVIRIALNNPALTLNDLIEVKLPFDVTNIDTPELIPGGGPVQVAMLRSAKRSSVLLGWNADTVTAQVPPDVWIPGEPLILLEEIDLAMANDDGSLVVLPDGNPQMTRQLRVTLQSITLGCGDVPRITCNPLRGPGQAGNPGYVEVRTVGDREFPEGWLHRVNYYQPVSSRSEFEFRVVPQTVGRTITHVTQSMLDNVRVVPNPYLAISAFDYVADVRRLMFVALPPSGSIHIFTASGQYVQRLDWEPEDLQGTGDLAWEMNTKEGTEIASGVYMFVLETRDPESGNRLSKTGKFIVIK